MNSVRRTFAAAAAGTALALSALFAPAAQAVDDDVTTDPVVVDETVAQPAEAPGSTTQTMPPMPPGLNKSTSWIANGGATKVYTKRGGTVHFDTVLNPGQAAAALYVYFPPHNGGWCIYYRNYNTTNYGNWSPGQSKPSGAASATGPFNKTGITGTVWFQVRVTDRAYGTC